MNLLVSSSLTGLLLHTFELDPYLKSMLNWDLRMHSLTLLNVLLVHYSQHSGGNSSSNASDMPLSIAPQKDVLIQLLDNQTGEAEVSIIKMNVNCAITVTIFSGV